MKGAVMSEGFVARDRYTREFYKGGGYTHQGERYPYITRYREEAKVYKSRKVLQRIIDEGRIPAGGGWFWGLEENKEECHTCGAEFEDKCEYCSMAYPFCSQECYDNYMKYEGSDDE